MRCFAFVRALCWCVRASRVRTFIPQSHAETNVVCLHAVVWAGSPLVRDCTRIAGYMYEVGALGFVHHSSRTIFCRAVPNPNVTIRNFWIAVAPPTWVLGSRGRWKRTPTHTLHERYAT
jgi:hypothetical protein